MTAGHILLENGAETYRVEDTVSFICKTGGLTDVSVISLPTGTIYSFVDEDGVPHSEVVRTKSRTTSLRFFARPRRATSWSNSMSSPSGMATEKRTRSLLIGRAA